jgi:putative phage-type endonuclease
MLLSELEELDDELDKIIFDDEPSIFDDEYAVELVETAMHLMDEYLELYPHAISEPDFLEILLEEIKELFYIQFEEQIETLYNGDDIEDDLSDLLEDAFQIFITTFHPDKLINTTDSEPEYYELNDEEFDIIENKIQQLRDAPQPVQRTAEWYQFRWNLITASNAWKAFESQSNINQLIYEKCQPIKTISTELNNVDKMVNVNTSLHWGQKYEPLSVIIYEDKYNTKVEDFGCIQHRDFKFLGASPDGIIVNKESDRYGRMLEIKNVVSREITGIPKKEYWTQMQLQMEVCDLDECDFLETKFTEYSDSYSYEKDIKIVDDNSNNIQDNTISADEKLKGIIVYFHRKDGTPFYVYKPLHLKTHKEINEWEESTVSLYQSETYNYIFMKFIYWKLEVLSCILVLRKTEWFKNNIQQLENVWKTIEQERVTGYEHRAPNKKPKKEPISYKQAAPNGCFLQFKKIIKLDENTA